MVVGNKFQDLCTQLLVEGLGIRFMALGRSMYPTIREKDIITIAPIAPSEVKRGDIILYRSDSGIVAHRVLRVTTFQGTKNQFTMGPDTWGKPREVIGVENVLGRVLHIERDGMRLDPYSARAKVRLALHKIASRTKRLLRNPHPFGFRG
ncbi:MAG: signal peptidase I [Deltaproteobacteria bacterium]|nr:signal peptidase I [Deltaproteobacteria bacterium]